VTNHHPKAHPFIGSFQHRRGHISQNLVKNINSFYQRLPTINKKDFTTQSKLLNWSIKTPEHSTANRQESIITQQ